MKELRFQRSIYSGRALDEAIKVFGGHATFEQAEEAEHFVVRIASRRAPTERALAGAFANYALGLTVDRGGSDDAPEAD